MNLTKTSSFSVVLVLAAVFSVPSSAETSRARLLYETHCNSCHNKSVHNREFRIASTYAQIRAQVERWSSFVRADWTAQEVNDVTEYLNTRYYQFECPDKKCNQASLETGTSAASYDQSFWKVLEGDYERSHK